MRVRVSPLLLTCSLLCACVITAAHVPKGLEIASAGMKVGERAVLLIGRNYGYSNTRRPEKVPPRHVLRLEVTMLRWEKEKNLHQMSTADKIEFVKLRRDIGKRLFSEGKFASAYKQYEKVRARLRVRSSFHKSRPPSCRP